MKNLKFIYILTALFLVNESVAQVGGYFEQFNKSQRWSAGIQLSPTIYNGDADNFTPGFSFGGHAKYSISQSFGLKLSGNIGTLNGGRQDQSFSRNSNGTVFLDRGNQNPSEDSYEFTNNFRDLNLVTVYTLGNISFLRPLRKIQMFAFFGLGAIWSDVTESFTDPEESQYFYQRWGREFITPLDASGNELSDAGLSESFIY